MDQPPSLPSEHRPSESTESPKDGEFSLPPCISDHELLRRIGGGSYGDVWLGKNIMGVYRAIKIVYRKRFNDKGPFERELSGIRKFEPISRSHEGFVDILHIGLNEEQGYFYYVMEVGDDQVSGQNIESAKYLSKTLSSEIVRHGRLPADDCLELGLKLSSALEKLHGHGLVHRDVKPSNIIFVDGEPKLADIGLVADIGGASTFVGTEGFIPPEGPGTPQADIYGLGKILYEASTGKDRQEFPGLPNNFDTLPDKSLFLEINAVIVRACVGARTERYQTAREMHADLELLASGKSVKRLRLLEHRFAQLKRIGVTVVLGGTVVAGVAYHFYREWKMNFVERQRQVGSDVAYGSAAMDSGDLLKALPYFVEALSLDQNNPKTESMHRLRIGSVLAQCPKLTQFWIASTNLQHCEFSPDGKRVLVAQRDGPVEIYDVETSKLYAHPFGEHCGYASYSSNGEMIVTAGNTVCLWNASTLEQVHCFPHSNWVCSARFNPSGNLIVTACADGFIRVWDAASFELKYGVKVSESMALFADFSHDGSKIVTGGFDHTAAIRDSIDGHILQTLAGHNRPVRCAAFSPDDTVVITACEDHKARAFQVADGNRIMPDLEHPDGVSSVQLSVDGRLLVTASIDGTAKLWRGDTLKPLNPNPVLRHNERLGYCGIASDGHRIVSCCTDGSIRVWDLAGATVAGAPSHRILSENGSRFLLVNGNNVQIGDVISDRILSSFSTEPSRILLAKFDYNGRFVLTVSEQISPIQTNWVLQLWEASSGTPRGASIVTTNQVNGITVSDTGTYLATYVTNIVQIWDVTAGKAAGPPFVHEHNVACPVFRPGSTQIATLSGNLALLWNENVGWKKMATLQHVTTVAHVEYSADGRRLLCCCSDTSYDKCYAQIWDSESGKTIGSRLWHRDGVGFGSFSADGHLVATASEDFTAVIWDGGFARPGLVLRHAHEVRSVSFSSDSELLATAGRDRMARVWDGRTGAPLTPWLIHLRELSVARFSPDKGKIITIDRQGNTWVWPLPSDKRPLEDLRKVALLLTSGAVVASNPTEFPRTSSLLEAFVDLRRKYSADFQISSKQVAAWRDFQIRQSHGQ